MEMLQLQATVTSVVVRHSQCMTPLMTCDTIYNVPLTLLQGVNRERAPFVLTPDFVYIMGGKVYCMVNMDIKILMVCVCRMESYSDNLKRQQQKLTLSSDKMLTSSSHCFPW